MPSWLNAIKTWCWPLGVFAAVEGTPVQQTVAYAHNQAHRFWLVVAAMRWGGLGWFAYTLGAATEHLKWSEFLVGTFMIGFTLGMAMTAWALAAYVLLGRPDH